jgi:endonuclease/exonuclease/phosphatase family metal-dependent hydrolase
MRRQPFVLLAAALLVACSPQTPASPSTTVGPSPPPTPSTTPSVAPSPAEVEFTLMDFNIEYGGVQVDFAKIVEAARAADPDVIAIEEAEGNTERLADELGWPHANIRNQVISKFPIVDPPDADGRYVYVELAPGAVIAISNVHLPSDPYGPYAVRDGSTPEDVIRLENETRLPAIEERLAVLPDLVAAGIPTFLTGDFNAPSHLDWTEAAVGTRPHIRYPLAWPVSTAIEDAGFRDTYREIHPDPVTHPGLTWWAGRPIVDDYPDHADPQDRIDIIYAAGEARTTAVAIAGEVGGPQVDISVDPWGTDHRAVLSTFTVRPGVPRPYIGVDDRLVTVGDPITVRYLGPADELQFAPATGDVATEPIQAVSPDAAGPVWEIDTGEIEPGDYEVRLTRGGEIVSASPVSIAAPGAKPVLTLSKPTYTAGEAIEAAWRDAPGARWDWIGIYPRGGDPLVDDYLFYAYTGQEVAGTVTIDEDGEGEWPIPPGDYDAHYLLDDGYTSLASASFSIAP